jgi:hypothetical protein
MTGLSFSKIATVAMKNASPSIIHTHVKWFATTVDIMLVWPILTFYSIHFKGVVALLNGIPNPVHRAVTSLL